MLNLKKLEQQLDEALENETKESLLEWLNKKRKLTKDKSLMQIDVPTETRTFLDELCNEKGITASQYIYELIKQDAERRKHKPLFEFRPQKANK